MRSRLRVLDMLVMGVVNAFLGLRARCSASALSKALIILKPHGDSSCGLRPPLVSQVDDCGGAIGELFTKCIGSILSEQQISLTPETSIPGETAFL